MKYTFQEVAVKGVKRWTEDGKRKQKTKRFFQTINPFNKNKSGQQKGRSEIMKEILAEREEWLNQ